MDTFVQSLKTLESCTTETLSSCLTYCESKLEALPLKPKGELVKLLVDVNFNNESIYIFLKQRTDYSL